MNSIGPASDLSTYHTAPHVPMVLIVEDDLLLSRMYSEKFTIDGFRVEVAHDGEKALDFLKTTTPDCVLLDLHIPKIDGLTVLEMATKEIHSLPPVLALTNIADKDQKKRASALGVKEYLVKAMLTPEEVVQKVKDAINPTPAPPSKDS